MLGLKCQLEESFCDALLLFFFHKPYRWLSRNKYCFLYLKWKFCGLHWLDTRQFHAWMCIFLAVVIPSKLLKYRRRHRCHQLFCGDLKYITSNVLKICFEGLWVWWCIQAHTCCDDRFHWLQSSKCQFRV